MDQEGGQTLPIGMHLYNRAPLRLGFQIKHSTKRTSLVTVKRNSIVTSALVGEMQAFSLFLLYNFSAKEEVNLEDMGLMLTEW